ncbi:hypothetical protein LTR56_020894 [Elasticomyces elasticus]|nr:hypothetical protein LTR56_020894 [Elasticomyces elasticus]KAK3654293.1 hypothetical protein LTR22_010769 [Elasticomyces elasticus]KAK4920226.1 hypothetical protein LTR49_012177 [Elasticomyces elasticus]KAK5749825.1 hypothetical protein LTS12_020115 [Elasticomyces elasticus]
MLSRAYFLAAVTLLTVISSASNQTSHCMSRADAQQVADNYQNLQTQFTEALVMVSLSEGFALYSDSTSELINSGCNGPVPMGEATFSSRDAFLAGQGSQPNLPFYQFGLWHTCKQVVVRWRFFNAPLIITGIMALETIPAPPNATFPWLIETVYSEFDSGSWLVGLGLLIPNCDSNGTAQYSRKRRALPMIGHVI